MKILFALTKPQLAEIISEGIPAAAGDVEYAFNEIELSQAFARLGARIDYLVIHEDIFEEKYPWEWMNYIKSSVHSSTKIMIILSQSTDSLYREIVKRLSIDLQITLIQGALTGAEIVDELNLRIFNKTKVDVSDSSRVVTFLSASPKDGATTIAISTAICLAQRMLTKKVLLIDLNLKSPEIRDHLHITTDKGYPLIQADCDSGTLEQAALLKACDKIKGIENLYILTGIQRREWAEKITVGEIEHLLINARKTFDLVITDVHTFPDQAATLKAVKDSDDRIVVAQSIITSYQSSWNDWYNSVWQHYGLSEKDFRFVLNREGNKMFDSISIESWVGTKIISRVRNVKFGAGLKSINYGQPLYLNDEQETIDFQTDILFIASWIANKAQFELTAMDHDKKSAFRGKNKTGLRKLLTWR